MYKVVTVQWLGTTWLMRSTALDDTLDEAHERVQRTIAFDATFGLTTTWGIYGPDHYKEEGA